MNITEAVKLGLKFKRNSYQFWQNNVKDWAESTVHDTVYEGILATDWEVLFCEKHNLVVYDIHDPLYEINGVLTCSQCKPEEKISE